MGKQTKRITIDSIPLACRFSAGHANGFTQFINCNSPHRTPDSFIDQVGRAVESWPVMFRSVLSQGNKEFVLAHRPAQIGEGSLKSDNCDFYHRSPAEVGGFYTGNKMVVLQEIFNKRTKIFERQTDIAYTAAHEAFHALDEMMHLHKSDEYLRIYKLDVMQLGKAEKYGYLLQEGHRGKQEALATAGGEVLSKDESWEMAENWPYTTSFVAAIIDYLIKEYKPEAGLSKYFSKTGIHEAQNHVLRQQLVKAPWAQTCIKNVTPETLATTPMKNLHDDRHYFVQRETILYQMIRAMGIEEAKNALRVYKRQYIQGGLHLAT